MHPNALSFLFACVQGLLAGFASEEHLASLTDRPKALQVHSQGTITTQLPEHSELLDGSLC